MNDSSSTLAIIIGIIILHFVIGIGLVIYKISTAEKRPQLDEDESESDENN